MADTTHDPRVDAYIASLPDWQQSICLVPDRPHTAGRFSKDAFRDDPVADAYDHVPSNGVKATVAIGKA